MINQIKRGELYFADLSPAVGSEQSGFRPVVILSNDIGNRHSPTVVVAAITGKAKKTKLPTHYTIPVVDGLERSSVVLLEQLRTLDKCRLDKHIGQLDEDLMNGIDDALAISLGLKKEDKANG